MGIKVLLDVFRCILLALCVLPFICLSGLSQGRTIPTNVRAAVEGAINRMRPALVRIHVVSTDFRDGREIKMQAVGSGAIITKDGYLVTNHHVAGHAARLVCTLWNREEIEADLIGTDPLTDISVLKLRPEKVREFTAAGFGDSSKLLVGDSVLAMGSPMALSQSVTLGIISNVEMTMPRHFGSSRFELDGEDVGSLVRWIGHDASIYGGNSGGPLVNLKGEIVGINEIRFGLSGAIPGNLAKSVINELITHRKIRRSWLGLDAQPLFKHSEEGERGVLIGGVVQDSPASCAGLQAGDILIRLGNTPTNVRYDEQMPEFMSLVTSLPLGKEVPAVIVRAGKQHTLKLVPIERGEVNPPELEVKPWGLTGRNISFLTAKEMKRTNQLGVFITSVRPGGPSGEAKPALGFKDILTEVNSTPVKNIDHLMELTRTLTHGKNEPTPLIATFERESRRYLTVVKIGLQELRDPGLEVTKAWLPIETHVISRDISRQLNMPDLKGFYITQVYPNSTAEKAGLRPGDFITSVDEERLTASGPENENDLATLIRQYEIGKTVQLSVLRNKERIKVSVELARSPKLKREMKKYRNDDFEFTARDVAFFDIAEEQWKPGQRGALVEEVKSGSWAELGSLSSEDLIVEVDGQPVDDIDTLKTAMDQIAKDKKQFVIIKVLRGIHTAFLELEPSWKR